MHSIDAVSAAPRALAWLTSTAQPRVLNLFDQACNLVNERNEVLSIVAEKIGNGPFSLVVAELPDLSWTTKVSIPPGQIVLGELSIDCQRAQLWNPRPDWDGLHKSVEVVIAQTAAVEVEAPHLPQSLIVDLAAAVSTPDPVRAARVAVQLAGLGPGLTPAGDDFLMGAMHAVWILHPVEPSAALCGEITEAALPRTTTLSAAWLRAAAAGEASIRWHSLFAALVAAHSAQLSNAIEQILATGETSGADALCGFIQTLRGRSQNPGPSTGQ